MCSTTSSRQRRDPPRERRRQTLAPAAVVDSKRQVAHTLVVGMAVGPCRARESFPVAVEVALVPLARAHPVRGCLHQDPLVLRAFEAPRGHAGDPVLLDLLYRHLAAAEAVAEASALGRGIYACTSRSAFARAVQERRELLAARVDAAAAGAPRAEVLALGAGHLREAELSRAHAARELKRWTALDPDPAAVETMRALHAGGAVMPTLGSAKALASGGCDLGAFDLIYSAAVCDELPDPAVAGLARRLLGMLKPGGEPPPPPRSRPTPSWRSS